MITYSNIRIILWYYSEIVLTKVVVMYHINLVPRMGLAESLTLYHQAHNLVQIWDSEMHAMLKNYI